MAREGWEGLAAWRDYRMGERGDLWHRAIIDPTVLGVVGPVRGLRILDLACGNGYLTRRWARQGAAEVLGVDASPTTLAFARRRERARPSGAKFLKRNATHLRGIASSAFDLVVANMALQDIQDAKQTIREVARVLRPQGRFVFSLSHPCFDLDERSGWVVERVREAEGMWHDVVWRKVRAYRDERTVRVPWKISAKETGYTTAYHRTLSTYSRLLRTAGLSISRLEEPAPLPEAIRKSPQGPYLVDIPLHLVIEARPYPTLRRTLSGRKRTTGRASRTSADSLRRGSPRSGRDTHRRGSGSRGRGSRTGS